MTRSALLPLAAALALGACSGEAKKEAGAGNAAGQVLPGSTSDAMLPFDSVKSQAPLAPKAESTGKADAKSAGAKSAAAETAEPAAGAADAPAEADKGPADQ